MAPEVSTTSKALKPQHDFMIIRPRPDIHQEFTQLSIRGGEIDTALFGKVRVDDLVQYRHSGLRNQFAFGEVLRIGSGFDYGPSKELPEVSVGTLIGFDLAQVAIEAPSREANGTENVYFIPFKAAICRFTIGDRLPKPLGNYVMTEEDEITSARFAFGAETKLVLPDTVRSAGMKTNPAPHTNVRYSVEQVLSVGPGKFIKKVFVEPTAVVGELVLFSSVLSVDFNAYGKRYRFTPWTQIMGTATA